MAVYECDYGRHRYPQAQQSIYFTHVIGRSMDTYTMRLCPSHFRQLQIEIGELLAELDDDSTTSQTCDKCGRDRGGALFAKVFPAREEMRQFVADFCPDCLSTVGNQLRIFNGRHMTDS